MDASDSGELLRGGVPAASALPFALLLLTLDDRSAPVPPGWARAVDRTILPFPWRLRAWLADFRAVAFVNAAGGLVCTAIPGTRVNLRGVLSVLRRRIFGGASALSIRFVRAVQTAFPGHEMIVVGHSSGGGTASYLGSVLHLPSITFNGARTRAALRNNGARQLNVIVRGDFWGDPGILPGKLAGETLWLDGAGLGRAERHSLATIVSLLETRFADGTSAT